MVRGQVPAGKPSLKVELRERIRGLGLRADLVGPGGGGIGARILTARREQGLSAHGPVHHGFHVFLCPALPSFRESGCPRRAVSYQA